MLRLAEVRKRAERLLKSRIVSPVRLSVPKVRWAALMMRPVRGARWVPPPGVTMRLGLLMICRPDRRRGFRRAFTLSKILATVCCCCGKDHRDSDGFWRALLGVGLPRCLLVG